MGDMCIIYSIFKQDDTQDARESMQNRSTSWLVVKKEDRDDGDV